MVESFEPNRIDIDPAKATQLSSALQSIYEQLGESGINPDTHEFAGIIMGSIFRDILPPNVVSVTIVDGLTFRRSKRKVKDIPSTVRQTWTVSELHSLGKRLDPNWDSYSPLRINPS